MLWRGESQQPVFRVLALDGGGLRGIFTASFLASVEHLAGGPIADYFDLVTGTSTGGILGLALAFGIPAQTILDLYVKEGRRVFAHPRHLGMLLRPRYDNAALARIMRSVFGNRLLNDTLVPVCITSYELTASYPRIWKDDHSVDIPDGGEEPAWKVALATAAAPVYFPAVQVAAGDSHVDGGLYANNPALVGLTEAFSYFKQPLDRIRILSVGAGERAERIPFERARRMGVWQWKTAVYEHMLIAQARSAHEIARRLLRPGQYERVNIPLEHPYPLDDWKAARTLIEPGVLEARMRHQDLRRGFLFAPATLGRAQKAAAAVATRDLRDGFRSGSRTQ